ncbi:MAG TPA: hypothetical protein VHX65_14280 [Pirellulales bacterium]|jgi:hypothetical protein|nr:hypothetical protein [Pirellulales bacterium]
MITPSQQPEKSTDPNLQSIDYFDTIYLVSKLSVGSAGSQVWRVRSSIDAFEKWLGRTPLLRDLNDATLSDFIKQSQKAGRNAGGIRWLVGLLLQLWRFAVRRGDISQQSGRPVVSAMKSLRSRKRDSKPRASKLKPATLKKPTQSTATLLCDFVAIYERGRDLRPRSIEQYRNVASLLSRHLRRPARIADLNSDTLNAFIAGELERVSRESARSYRRSLLVLWRDAFERGILTEYPRRVRAIKVPARIIDGYDVEQLGKLLDTAANLDGVWWRTMIERRHWWYAFILTAWNTGLRLGDLLAVEHGQINSQPDGSGRLSVVMSKTGRVINRQLPPTNVAAIDRCIASGLPRKLCFPMGGSRNALLGEFRCIAAAAGLRGTLRWIRRGSASEVERLCRGAGRLHLGHKSPGLFETAYKVDRIVKEELILPPQPTPRATGERKDGST